MNHSATTPPASTPLRLLLTGAGLLFVASGTLFLFVVGRLLFADQLVFDISGHDRLFWALCGVVAFCLLMLGINFLSASWQRRTHNIVPGPTLYLLGVTLVIIAMFMALSGAWMTALVMGVAGFACMSLEYRSEFI